MLSSRPRQSMVHVAICGISSALRLLFPPLEPSLVFSKPATKPYSLLAVVASAAPGRRRSLPHRAALGLSREHGTTTERKRNREKGPPMEETKSTSAPAYGFNKRRADGKDEQDKPKKALHLKQRTLNPTNTIAYVQILGTGMDTQDTSPSVLLFFDKQRFIFNAGEGLQRYCSEHKIRLSKIDHIFLSRVCSETTSGLPGLLLTLAGIGEEGLSVNVWGPSDLNLLVDAMKAFIPHAAMVHTRSFGPSNDATSVPNHRRLAEPFVLVDNEVVKIAAIILHINCSKDSQAKSGNMSVIYICELPQLMGKFDPKKAAALGLRPGPKYRELQSGNSVKSDSLDITVHPCDVIGPPVPGPIFLLVDCPTDSHLEQLVSMKSLSEYYSDGESHQPKRAKYVNCVIHLSPVSVVQIPSYQKWMKKFGSAKHIIAGHQLKNVEIPILKASSKIAARLNYLCPQFFPASGFLSNQHYNDVIPLTDASNEGSANNCESISAENLLKFTLRPYAQLGLDRLNVPFVTAYLEVVDELLSEIPEIVDAAQHVKRLWPDHGDKTEGSAYRDDERHMIEEPWLAESTVPDCLESIKRDDMEIVLLGTGSSQPSKYRNVSSVFINLFSKGSLLFDCGEGTLGQLRRRYGIVGANDVVRNLKCAWVSHIHADHHAGLARVLALRRDLLNGIPHEPLLVIGPRQLKRFLDAYQRLEDLDMQFLDCRSTTEPSWNTFESDGNSQEDSCTNGKNAKNRNGPLFTSGSRMESYSRRPDSLDDHSAAYLILKRLKRLLADSGLDELISFPVVHCPQAFGIVLKAAKRVNSVGKVIPGWKAVYSGDTRPCPEVIKASRRATVLIHEATFEDNLLEEAIAKNHSTTKEAIEMGDSAGAYRIILTHFSQRYPKIPVFDETHMHNTCIAFDMMSINVADLPVLPKVLPHLKLLFKNEIAVKELDEVAFENSCFK